MNNQAIQPKSLRKEIFQGADIKGKNSSPGIAAGWAAVPGESKSNRLNSQAIQPKSLRKEVSQDAGIKGKIVHQELLQDG